MNVLISAYACGPKWGSEIGMGWNWVIHLAQHCKITVITEIGFKNDIEEVLPTLNLKFVPKFYYIDIEEQGRKLFWKQGSFIFYSFYKNWQLKAYDLAKDLINTNQFDIVHQLNMIGFREPGYLWKIKNIPYIIGPVGGFEQFPFSYLNLLSFRDKCFYMARSFINILQMKYLIRPKEAYRSAQYVLAATTTGVSRISKYSINLPIIIPETGAKTLDSSFKRNKSKKGNVINIVWCGIIKGSKGLPIALYSIANIRNKEGVHLQIIGDGPNLEKSKKLAQKLQLENVTWHGRSSNEQSKQIIANSDILFFTSLLEATSTVIFEALESGTPVLCHDACGFGNVIDESCGIKIPMISPVKSIELFTDKLNHILENPAILQSLSIGCYERIKQYYWDSKAQQLFDIYKECI